MKRSRVYRVYRFAGCGPYFEAISDTGNGRENGPQKFVCDVAEYATDGARVRVTVEVLPKRRQPSVATVTPEEPTG